MSNGAAHGSRGAPFGRRAVCVAFATGLLSACGEDAAPQPPPLRVAVQTVQRSEYSPSVSLTGEVVARVTSELSFRTGGRVLDRKVEIGDHVTPDQVLATLDPQEQQANVTAAEAGVQAAEAQLRQATSAFDRQRTLLAQGFTTRRDYDQAEEALRTAQGRLDAARAELGTAQDLLGQTTLRAGMAGIITARNVEAGQVVQAAQTVYTLAQDGPRDAIFNVYESIFVHEPTSQEIRVALVADPAVTGVARIREVSPVVDPAGGTVRVRLEIVDPPPAMTLGAALVGTGQFRPRQVIMLPWSALSSEGGQPAVWVVDPAARAVSLRRIAVEAYEVEQILVREGLEPDQVVVTRGQQLLHPGQVVDPVDGGAS
ncbi:efflux RND transporter periplasmic adaptor subunit [Roseomonas hellenica]|nr:efflux RND transporter periplasmic adaptor subunit [Plastoroseomonas hellenica]MBR0643289.1 efflux RND transporter periplasmic adaptor subunit [Plastoroseomonas hellenica]